MIWINNRCFFNKNQIQLIWFWLKTLFGKKENLYDDDDENVIDDHRKPQKQNEQKIKLSNENFYLYFHSSIFFFDFNFVDFTHSK